MKRIVLLPVVIALTLLISMPASANKPEPFYEGPFSDVQFVADCGDFTVTAYTEGYARIMFRLDRNGLPVRLSAHASGVDTLRNSIDASKLLTSYFSWNAQQDLPDGNFVRSGLFWHFIVPGHGPLLMETGRWEQQPDFSWVYINGLAVKDIDLLCSLLR
jgi:hypothetical protein